MSTLVSRCLVRVMRTRAPHSLHTKKQDTPTQDTPTPPIGRPINTRPDNYRWPIKTGRDEGDGKAATPGKTGKTRPLLGGVTGVCCVCARGCCVVGFVCIVLVYMALWNM